ncbi:TrkA family potassium uptake protein [Salinirubellus salinus]|uniref:TrkA family potassium uptake protein n=1 Tax=Salinirubellus salinus TaxID=1364945 RepID=A0A9E7U3U2_9EURY|nr:TrkA family potassium uptake protein [Salinirubellus salinus]UWM53595.1 TrkA family potassium uptake protein [Salinirubellus salinus]
MDLRVIVVGGGRVGYHAAESLEEQGHRVVVVERDGDRCEEIADAYVASVVEGDGTRPDILRQADPERADVILALTPNAGANLGACVLASRLNPDLRTVMRVATPAGAEGYEEVVDATVFPERAGARAAVNAATGDAMWAVESLPGELEIIEMRVIEDSPLAGRSLSAVSLPHGSLVVSAADGDRIASAETTLEPGRAYLVAAEPNVTDEVRQLFHG